MADLSRERIAELRASRNPLTWVELMALLEVYEASRPRPGFALFEAAVDPEDVASGKLYLQIDTKWGRITRHVRVIVPPWPERGDE